MVSLIGNLIKETNLYKTKFLVRLVMLPDNKRRILLWTTGDDGKFKWYRKNVDLEDMKNNET